jgi:hypothetical protein
MTFAPEVVSRIAFNAAPHLDPDEVRDAVRWVERRCSEVEVGSPESLLASVLQRWQPSLSQPEPPAPRPQPERQHQHYGMPRGTPEWGERADPDVAYRELAKIRALLGDHRERPSGPEGVSLHTATEVPPSAQEDDAA